MPAKRNQFTRLAGMIIFGWLAISVGCSSGDPQSSASDQPVRVQAELGGLQIWRQTQQVYANANTYQDAAVLRLTYRLNGQWIEEFHPQSVAFARQTAEGESHGLAHKIHAKIFNARLVNDGQNMICRVFDSPTGNLDRQTMIQPVSPVLSWADFLADPIGHHFLSGKAELPLRTSSLGSIPQGISTAATRDIEPGNLAPVALATYGSQGEQTASKSVADNNYVRQAPNSIASAANEPPALFPISIGLLSGDAFPRWLKSASNFQRIEDADIDAAQPNGAAKCFRVKIPSEFGTVVLWIDQTHYIIRKIVYPVGLLSEQLTDSPEITDLQMVVNFGDVQVDEQLDQQVFSAQLTPDARPVEHFVKIPEEFPAELIGHKIPAATLTVHDSSAIHSSQLAGFNTLMLFTDAASFDRLPLDQLSQLSRTPPGPAGSSPRRVALVLCGPPNWTAPIAQRLVRTSGGKLSVFVDPQYKLSGALQVGAMPTAIVLDSTTKIHYSKTLDDPKDLTESSGVLERVEDGTDIASEMHQAYQKFMDDYHQQLLAANPYRLTNRGQSQSPARTQIQRNWTLELTQPGPIWQVGSDDTGSIQVLDGWQTLVSVDSNGNQLSATRMGVPKNIAAQQIRATRNQAQPLLASFGIGEKQVHVLDNRQQLLFSYPAANNSDDEPEANRPGNGANAPGAVIDAVWLEQGDGPLLLVAFSNAVHLVDANSGNLRQSRSIKQVARLVQLGPHTWVAAGNDLVPLDIERTSQAQRTQLFASALRVIDISPPQGLEGLQRHETGEERVVAAQLRPGIISLSSIHADARDGVVQVGWRLQLPASRAGLVGVYPCFQSDNSAQDGWVVLRDDGQVWLLDRRGKKIDAFSVFCDQVAPEMAGQPIRAACTAPSPRGSKFWVSVGSSIVETELNCPEYANR